MSWIIIITIIMAVVVVVVVFVDIKSCRWDGFKRTLFSVKARLSRRRRRVLCSPTWGAPQIICQSSSFQKTFPLVLEITLLKLDAYSNGRKFARHHSIATLNLPPEPSPPPPSSYVSSSSLSFSLRFDRSNKDNNSHRQCNNTNIIVIFTVIITVQKER